MTRTFGWLGIVRLGAVQAALGAIVVLSTSTMNRVMVVELALPAVLPGALVALHYGVQVLRPRMGYGSDMGGRRTPWIVGGMAALTAGGIGAASGTALMAAAFLPGLLLALASYVLIGLGVGAAGTSLLTLMAARTDEKRRAPAATILWLMMILGIVVTSGVTSKLLDPFSPGRLVWVTACVACVALVVAVLAVWGLEGAVSRPHRALRVQGEAQPRFTQVLREVWSEPQARRFAIFVFVSMLAYSAQEVVLEPFAGAVFRLTPGQTAGLTGLQHLGVLAGMAGVALCCLFAGEFRHRAMRAWTVGGCVASTLAMGGMAGAALVGPAWPLHLSVVLLGAANGAFAVSAIGAMMGLASSGQHSREGTRVGLWGAAQAVAFGAGGLFGTGLIDLTRLVFVAPGVAYAAVFIVQATVFLLAARLASGVFGVVPRRSRPAFPAVHAA
jgi:BCD family chlorophyll transporter-like MFS transporter